MLNNMTDLSDMQKNMHETCGKLADQAMELAKIHRFDDHHAATLAISTLIAAAHKLGRQHDNMDYLHMCVLTMVKVDRKHDKKGLWRWFS